MKILSAIVLWLALVSASFGAALLPPGKQQFLGNNGAPLAGGSVQFYIPGTTTPKDTYRDAGGTILNTNPVQLDSGGFAVIYGTGAYRQIVKDAFGNTLYDQLTADTSANANSWAGNSGGSANAVTVVAQAFAAQNGQTISWRNTLTNTGPTTLSVGGSVYAVVKDTLAGPVPLTGGELTTGNISTVLYDTVSGNMHLVTPVATAPTATIASAATVDLGGARSPNVVVSGSATISSFGSGAFVAQPLYFVSFTGNATLTHNATSLILPSGTNLTVVPGSLALVRYLGAGNWQVLAYESQGTELVNAQGGTTYTVLASDQGKLLSLSNASPIAVTVPQATGAFPAGFWFDVQNVGEGAATLTPTTSTINGAGSLLLPSGYGLRVISDGANWRISGLNPLRGRVLLNTLTAASSAALTDTTSFTSLFNYYDLVLDNVLPATNLAGLRLTLQSGGVFQTTAYVNGGIFFNAAGTANTGLGISTYIEASPPGVVIAAGSGVSGVITIALPSTTTAKKPVRINTTYFATAQDTFTAGAIWNGGNGAITGVNFFESAGNIASGTIKVYGYN